jgi:hypothetical protein
MCFLGNLPRQIGKQRTAEFCVVSVRARQSPHALLHYVQTAEPRVRAINDTKRFVLVLRVRDARLARCLG